MHICVSRIGSDTLGMSLAPTPSSPLLDLAFIDVSRHDWLFDAHIIRPDLSASGSSFGVIYHPPRMRTIDYTGEDGTNLHLLAAGLGWGMLVRLFGDPMRYSQMARPVDVEGLARHSWPELSPFFWPWRWKGRGIVHRNAV